MHSQYPTFYEVEAQLSDFDSIITAEYSTQYTYHNDIGGSYIIKRLHARVMRTSNNSYFIGIDFDNKDTPAVWRRFVTGQVDTDNNADRVFGNTAESGIQDISIRMNARCTSAQIRFLFFAYRSRMELVSSSLEHSRIEAL